MPSRWHMVNSLRSTRLLEWCFGTFHPAFLVLAAFLLLYATGNAGAVLGALNTLLGVGVFALLWATTWWSTQRAVRGLYENGQFFIPAFGDMLSVGVKWGAVNGALFFLFLFGGIGLFGLAFSAQTSQFGAAAVFFLFAGCIGAIFALMLGAVFGIVFTLVDAALVGLAFFFYWLCVPRETVPADIAQEVTR